MFGLSLAETAVIIIVALLFIGPKELPTVVRAVMRVVRQIRGYGNEFRKAFDDIAEESKLRELHDEVTRPMIVDLEGKQQPTYDISSEMAEYQTRRKAIDAPKPEPTKEPGDAA